MTKPKKIQFNSLPKLFEDLKKSGKIIIAPRQKGKNAYFAPVDSFDQVAAKYIQTALSAKSVVLPRVEELFRYLNDSGSIKVEETRFPEQEVVVFGLHPCDAAAFNYLSEFFLKENPDFHYNKRREKVTFITLACKEADDFCFCTSVGMGPGDSNGSDMLLTDTGDGSYYAEPITAKGEAIVNTNSSLFQESEEKNKEQYLAKVPLKFNIQDLNGKVENIYSSPMFVTQSYQCLGCGACAFSCPTCTCFDIQDEVTPDGGVRLRLWDTCALGQFTLHASGHNPRTIQSQRWKHRVMHKFKYSVDNLNMISCVGCGRCARVCPAQMNIVEQVTMLTEA